MHGLAMPEAPRLEVRWIRRGRLDAPLLDWFARFPFSTESRVDHYLTDPDFDGLSVKVRGGQTLEVKVRHGVLGDLVVPDRAWGLLETWQRFSFTDRAARWQSLGSPAWTAVSKVRRMTFFDGAGEAVARSHSTESVTGCAVELSDVTTSGRRWWTLGLESTGPESALGHFLSTTAETLFSVSLPAGLDLTQDESGSYNRWLRTDVR